MDHDERWRLALDGGLSSLYLDEVLMLLNGCIAAAESLEELAPTERGSSQLVVDGELGSAGHRLVAAAGRLQSLLFAGSKVKGESRKRFELRTRRAAWLREEVFADIDVQILNDRQVRNAIEHFDDRIDEVAEKVVDGDYELPLLVVVDAAVSSLDTLAFLASLKRPPRTVGVVRTYVADTKTFHVLGWKFSVERVAECCLEMRERLFERGLVDSRIQDVHFGRIHMVPGPNRLTEGEPEMEDYSAWSDWELRDRLLNPLGTAAALGHGVPTPDSPHVNELEAIKQDVREEFRSRGYTDEEVETIESGDYEAIIQRDAKRRDS